MLFGHGSMLYYSVILWSSRGSVMALCRVMVSAVSYYHRVTIAIVL
jgi:hypothetical protein